MIFKKGKLVFTDELQQEQLPNGAAYFTAKALAIVTENNENHGLVATLKVSDLIQKQARFVTDGVNTIEAHKLFTWPSRLGDHEAWADSKRAFIEAHLMNFPIEIISVDADQFPTWTYITPEQFKKVPANLEASAAFQQYLDEQGSYFFLRKDRNEPV